MLFHTHLLIGIGVFLLTRPIIPHSNDFIFFLFVLLGSILPDIDERKSKINQWSGFIGKIIALFAKHRGFFHSLLFFVISSLLLGYFWSRAYATGLFLGYLAHLLGDGVTKMGVQVFYPFSKFKIRGPIRVGSMAEGAVMVIIALLIVKSLF